MALPFLIFASRIGLRRPVSQPVRQPASSYGAYAMDGRVRFASASLAIGIAGGVGAALVLALVVPAMEDNPPPIFKTWSVPAAPQPTAEPAPQPQAQPRRSADVTLPKPQVLTPPLSGEQAWPGEAQPDPGPSPGVSGSGEASGGSGTITAVAEPVFNPARRDMRFARAFQPPYPAALERESVEGECPVSVTIAPSGRVSAVRDLGCTHSAFFRVTEQQALRHWRFRPATRDGVAVESTSTQTVRFRITE